MFLKKQKFPPKNAKEFGWLLLNWISSLGLASALLIYLTLLTLFGTLNQMEDGLYDSVSKYFSGFFFYDKLFGMPLVLPGAYLILTILCINMGFGTVLRIRKNPKNIALYGVHFSIIFLIFAGFIEDQYKVEGSMALFPGNSSSEYVSYHNWQLEVYEIGESGEATDAFVIPVENFRKAKQGNERTFFTDEIPFELVVQNYTRNCFIVPDGAKGTEKVEMEPVDGYLIFERDPEEESEANLPGVHLRFLPKAEGGAEKEALVWAHIPYHLDNQFLQPIPHVFEMDGRKWGVQMVKERIKLPFEIKLDEFVIEKYPGTQKARKFESAITKIEKGMEPVPYKVGMNEPMRDRGIVMFQSKWGPQDGGPDTVHYSVFAVVDNPSDRWPEYAMYMILVFILIHFIFRLVTHIQKQTRKKPAPPIPSPSAAATGNAANEIAEETTKNK